jgi:glucose/arabinose dehydrogenase
MNRYWLAALGVAFAGAALAQTNAPAPVTPPPRALAAPVPGLAETRAQEIFTGTCASCHSNNLTGGRGPSLLTQEFLNTHSDEQIVHTVTEGIPNSPMPAFKTMFTASEISQIPAFLRIRGGMLKGRPPSVTPDPNGKVIKSQKQTFKIETVARGLDQPWGLAFLPDGRMIFTERAGRLRFLDKNGKMSAPVKGTPRVFVRQDGGMFDIAINPDFVHNGWYYLSYSSVPVGYVPAPDSDKAPNLAPPTMTVLVRGHINKKNEWVDEQTLFHAPDEMYTTTSDHYGTRFLFDGKGHMFWSIGERHDMQMSQNLASPLGKIHRMNEDGSIPADNPFVHTPGADPSIWTYGNRNSEGLAFDPVTGLLWETENGPVGGDEINILEPGKNYGWGVVSMGLEPGINRQYALGMTPPIAWYNPAVAPSGTIFYTGDRYPGWKNNMFIATMTGQKFLRVEIKDRTVVAQEAVFEGFGRVRASAIGPDGLLYVLLQNRNGDSTGGSIVRLVPQN